MEKRFLLPVFHGVKEMTITANAVMVNAILVILIGKPFRTHGGIWRNVKVIRCFSSMYYRKYIEI
jgi:hypothetical protein